MPEHQRTSFSTYKANRALKNAAKEAPKAAEKQLNIKLSPYHAHSNSLLHSTQKGAGGYYRSYDHEINAEEVDSEKDYRQFTNGEIKKLSYGKRANLGAYANNFQRLGDRAWQNKHRRTSTTTEGDAALYDALLTYEKNSCDFMAKQLQDLKHLKVSYRYGYPCLMIRVKKSTLFSKHKTPTPATHHDWANFLLSYLAGSINALAVQNNIPHEITRRASFGFLSATLAPTDQSIRLSPGITPMVYHETLVTAIKNMDEVLSHLYTTIAEELPLDESCFFLSDEFTAYRGDLTNNTLNNLVELLFEPVDKKNQTTIYNIMRTAYAQDGISKMVYQSLTRHPDDGILAMKIAIQWAINHFSISDQNTLTFSQEEDIAYPITFPATENECIWYDLEFWSSILYIHDNIAKNHDNDRTVTDALCKLKQAYDEGKLSLLHAKLEALQDALLIHAGKLSNGLEPEDGAGSDSDSEETLEGKTIYGKKIITSNGMRAIISALIAYGANKKEVAVMVDKTYYEVPKAIKLIKHINGVNLTTKDLLSEAGAYLTDATPCITDENIKKSIPTFNENTIKALKTKTLIIDVTSATTDMMHNLLIAFAKSRSPALYLVSSGLKHEQLGSDNNSYGTIRLFSKDQTQLMKTEKAILDNEPRVKSPISHTLRRTMKACGATPTNASLMKKR